MSNHFVGVQATFNTILRSQKGKTAIDSPLNLYVRASASGGKARERIRSVYLTQFTNEEMSRGVGA